MKCKFKIFLLSSLFVFSQLVFGGTQCPEGQLAYFCRTPEMTPESPVKIFDFYNTAAKVIGLFEPELKKTGTAIALEAQWESPHFGAGVTFYNDQFHMMILGGTTRIDGFSLDAYAAVVCHELGHIIGGSPFQSIPHSEWSSSEGQADFFAASTCLPRFFKNSQSVEMRVEKAGYEMMKALRDFEMSLHPDVELSPIKRHAPDERIIKNTLLNNYPDYQCRYENFRNSKERARCWFRN